MKVKAIKITALALACTMSAGLLSACGGGGEVFNNEEDAIVFSTLALDRVFNPFFSTSATDSNIVGLTQIAMLANDKDGNPVCGDNEAVVVKDYQIITTGEGEQQETEYRFVLKNNIQFSNGSYLSIKDVLFNLYIYLDPVYTGSSTIYSTDIVGLKEYRTQASTEQEQDSFMTQFRTAATRRVNALKAALEAIYRDNGNSYPSDENALLDALAAKQTSVNTHIVEDYKKMLELFRQEVTDDFSSSRDTYTETIFKGADGTEYRDLFQTDVEQFLYNEGLIEWNKNANNRKGELTSYVGKLEDVRTWTEEAAIDYVVGWNIPDKVDEVLQYWRTASDLPAEIANQELEDAYSSKERTYKNISGITFANRTQSVTVNGKEYGVPSYEEGSNNTHVTSGNEVLSIKIHKVDPKAIWNFAFTVAPMYYYSSHAYRWTDQSGTVHTDDLISNFDYEENFGVAYGSTTFMNDVVKAADKIGVPVGAGPYAASRASGGILGQEGVTIQSGDFYDKGIVYYERNPYFNADGKGAAKIKKLRYSVVSESNMLSNLYTKTIDFAEPNAKPETVAELNAKANEGFGNSEVQTSGYGYIGINAGKVPSIWVRRAIMFCIDTKLTVDYYKTSAEPIYRSISKSNWAYPEGDEGKVPYYPYIGGPIPNNLGVGIVDQTYADFVKGRGYTSGQTMSVDDQKAFIRYLIGDLAGYKLNNEGIYYKGQDRLDYRFTIVGDEKDHPAYQALYNAYQFLDNGTHELGFKIEVKTDTYGLQKLSSGDLTVWAAAWSSTIDPDMYQVYHKDSTATSVLNWGYKQILQNVGGRYDTEYRIVVDELSPLIEQARETNDQNQRKRDYTEALTYVMELAVELPTYQRNDLFAYNASKIDTSTFTPKGDLTAYRGLTADLHLVSLNVEK